LINNHDWDFEKEAKNFIKKQQPDVNISVERAQEYGVNQFKRGVLGFEFVELKEWCEKQ
jgi:hypothetical protein